MSEVQILWIELQALYTSLAINENRNYCNDWLKYKAEIEERIKENNI